MSIPFHEAFLSGQEAENLNQVLLQTKKFSGDGPFTKQVHAQLEKMLGAKKALLTTSCTHGLEMAALLCDLQPGDEVIMPSYTFVSTANAVALRGAIPVWADVDVSTMNISIDSVKNALSKKTKAIAPVHYAGFSCDMDQLNELARSNDLWVIEDAAQSIGATYKGKPLGTQGDVAAFSFHETKNLHCGEGGALVLHDPELIERAEIIREKGTNRSRFLRGEIDKYTWVDIGSSYLPSELNAAFLMAQLEKEKEVTAKRVALWQRYYDQLQSIDGIKTIQPTQWNTHNGHLFFVTTATPERSANLSAYLKKNGVSGTFHYVALHSSPFGQKCGKLVTSLENTEKYAQCIVRLPMFYNLKNDQVDFICELVKKFNASEHR